MTRDKDVTKGWRPATRLVHGGVLRSQFMETAEAIYMNSGYTYGSAEEAEAAFDNSKPRFVYSRYANPTVQMFEERMALLEGAEACRGTSSGMAAVFAALLCQLKTGDRIVSSDALFGSCHFIVNDILPRYGIVSELVDGRDMEAWKRALATPAKVVFLETPSNPSLRLVDLAAVSQLAHAAGARVVVDNVFASPLLQKPLELGADVVVYSATKHIDGQGRALGGAILGTNKFIVDELQPFYRHTGPALSPMNAWLLLQGLETLPVRMERHVANARAVAEHLAAHPRIAWVSHAGLASSPYHALARKYLPRGAGSIFTFGIKGGQRAGEKFIESVQFLSHLANVGDAKTLVIHPASTTHRQLSEAQQAKAGVSPDMIRLSVGLETLDDILWDIDQALEKSAA